MTRSEAQKLIADIVKLRESATDAQAVLVPNVFPSWKQEKEYKAKLKALQAEQGVR